MARYEVRHRHTLDDHAVLDTSSGWERWIYENKMELSEAEAHIIAWALNAVANDYRLGRQKLDGRSDYEEYDGPTDGVAP